jgi:hypothetical protein
MDAYLYGKVITAKNGNENDNRKYLCKFFIFQMKNSVTQRGSFPRRGKTKEVVAYEWFRKIKREMAQFFLMNIMQAVSFLDSLDGSNPQATKSSNGFHH